MDKLYFPMFVDLSEMKILVVGGGAIAARRVKTLVSFARDITVVAPKICEDIRVLEKAGHVRCLPRVYEDMDAKGAEMVLAVTDDRELNRRIAQVCRETEKESKRRILLSVADDRTLCDFYFPSVIQTEGVTIGINSGGASPGTVKRIREKLERLLKQ